jgi:hypothetical protein
MTYSSELFDAGPAREVHRFFSARSDGPAIPIVFLWTDRTRTATNLGPHEDDSAVGPSLRSHRRASLIRTFERVIPCAESVRPEYGSNLVLYRLCKSRAKPAIRASSGPVLLPQPLSFRWFAAILAWHLVVRMPPLLPVIVAFCDRIYRSVVQSCNRPDSAPHNSSPRIRGTTRIISRPVLPRRAGTLPG